MLFLLTLRNSRDLEKHRSPQADGALGPDSTAVRLDDGLTDRKPKPDAAPLFLLRLPKTVKNMRQLFGGNAAPAVFHPEQNVAGLIACADRDRTARGGELHGIS